MGKYEKKKQKKSKKGWIIAIMAVVVLVLLILFVMPQVLFMIRSANEPEVPEELPAEATEAEEATQPQATYSRDAELTFPYVLEEGRLEVENLFSFSGINPDGELQDVTDVASITLKNMSDQHLESAAITATLQDGTQCTFAIADLPAGKSVMAFATGNEPLAQDGFCVELSTEAVFTDPPVWDQVSVSMVGTTVTLQNLSDEDITSIDVYCHDSFGESYFGGIAYKHTVNELAAGQTATVDISDSVMGMVDVVRIAINE